MELAEPYVKWQQPETEEEEFVEQLLERRRKHRIATASSFDSEGGESRVSEVSEIEDRNLDMEMETEVGGGEIRNCLKEEEFGAFEKAEEVVGEGLSGMNVYFDDTSGAKLSNGASEVQSRSTKLSVSEDGSMPQSSEVIEESVTIQGSHTITRTHHTTITTIKDTETEYHSSQPVQANGSHHSSLDSPANGNGDVLISNANDQEYNIKKDNSEELGVLLEGGPEPTDYDVEGVLKKQETHDLICPNCNTCITRRVILRKRKRVIKDAQLLNAKRDKIEETGHSEISHVTTQDTLYERSVDRVDLAVDAQNDVITCWSCFSLLIPSGKGFKLFKVFGGRKQPDAVALSDSKQTPLLTTDNREMSAEEGNTVDSLQLASGTILDQTSTTGKKGGDFKLFNSYGNNRDDKFKSSHQISSSQTSQVTTSSEKTFNAQGDTLPNHVEINTKQTSSSSFYNNGLPSVVTDYLATHTELAGKGQKIEAGFGFHNGSSTILHSHDEHQIDISDKPGTEFDSFKDRMSLKSEDIASDVRGSTLLNKLDTGLGKGQEIEAGSGFHNGSSTIFHSHDEYQIDISDKPGTDFVLFKDQMSLKSEDMASAVQGLTLINKLYTDLGKGQKIEVGSGLQNGSSTILHLHDENQIDINDKPGNEFDSFKDRMSLKSEDMASAIRGSTLIDKLYTDLGKGQKIEAGSSSQNGSSTILHLHDENQIDINDKPGNEFDSFKDRMSLKSEDIAFALQGSTLLKKLDTSLGKGSNHTTFTSRDDLRISIENGVKKEDSSRTENVSRDIVIPGTETQARGREQVARVGEARDLDILKSIVYGGLIESITSLGVVSSAAGAETSTLNILALGLANLIGGLILIFHNIKDLKNSPIEGPSNQVDRYYNNLGNRNNFKRHIVVAILSFLIFGLIPILTYGLSFLKSDNRDYKSLAVLGASAICITLLSIGKAHVKTPPQTARSYFNSITYYLSIAIAASGLSYFFGKLLQELITKTGWFDTTSSINYIFPHTTMPSHPAWGSY